MARSGLNAIFGDTNIVLLIIIAVCCNGIAFILGLVGLVVCTDPVARRNALIVTIIGFLCGGGAALGSMWHKLF